MNKEMSTGSERRNWQRNIENMQIEVIEIKSY